MQPFSSATSLLFSSMAASSSRNGSSPGQFRRGGELRRAFHEHLLPVAVFEHRRIAQAPAPPAAARHSARAPKPASQEIGANGLQRPAAVMAVQIVRGVVQLRLREFVLRAHDFVARAAAR